jgi:hypothetical protein
MTAVRLLVGTRKGAFIPTADGARQDWRVAGPFFAGWEIYHVKGSPADPNRLYAAQSPGRFGQIPQRCGDGGQPRAATGWHEKGPAGCMNIDYAADAEEE